MFIIQYNPETLEYDVINNGQVIYTARSYDQATKQVAKVRASVSAAKARSAFRTALAAAHIG